MRQRLRGLILLLTVVVAFCCAAPRRPVSRKAIRRPEVISPRDKVVEALAVRHLLPTCPSIRTTFREFGWAEDHLTL